MTELSREEKVNKPIKFCPEQGIVCIILKRVSVSATSVKYFFPSSDFNFSCTKISYNSLYPSSFNFRFKSLQYLLGLLLWLKTLTTTNDY